MIAVDWRGAGIPLLWTLLPSRGNSDAAARLKLFDRLAEVFPDMRIEALIGDREFIGGAWMASLQAPNIAFVLRLKDAQLIRRDGFPTRPLAMIARRLQRGHKLIVKQPCRLADSPDAPALRIIILRLKSGELLALAANTRPRAALKRYRDRWRIECLFANLKSRGFDLEATHLTDPAKLRDPHRLSRHCRGACRQIRHRGRSQCPHPRQGPWPQSLFALRPRPQNHLQSLGLAQPFLNPTLPAKPPRQPRTTPKPKTMPNLMGVQYYGEMSIVLDAVG